MSALSLSLTFDNHRVRMAGTPEAPLWVAKDVCFVLDIHNSRDTLAKLIPDPEKGVATIYTPGGPQEVTTVTEAGLYRLIARSRKPAAQRFQRWLFNDVLPAIRQHGSYPPPSAPQITAVLDLDDPKQLRGMLEALAARRMADSATIAELTPKAEAHDRLSEASGLVCLQDAARILGRKPNVFVRELCEDGILFRGAHGKAEPTAEYRERGYFVVKVREVAGDSYSQTLVTTRGLQWLSARYPATDRQASLVPFHALVLPASSNN